MSLMLGDDAFLNVHVYMYACMCHVGVYAIGNMHICMYVWMYIDKCICACMYVPACICMCVNESEHITPM